MFFVFEFIRVVSQPVDMAMARHCNGSKTAKFYTSLFILWVSNFKMKDFELLFFTILKNDAIGLF